MLRTLTVIAISTALITSCHHSKKSAASSGPSNTLTSEEKKDGWQLLFDGKSTTGWHTYGKSTVGAAWQAVDGTLHLGVAAKAGFQTSGGGDIVSDESFENYHFKIDWKISKNGNSGVIFNVQDEPAKYEYVWHTGPEMQVLDNDGHSDGKIVKHRAANLYDLISASSEPVKPVGEWNTAEIIQNKGKLELRLNGVTTVSTTEGDDQWKALIAGSKFKDMPDFGKIFKGHLALQDHGNEVWFRNIKIQKL